MTWQRVAAYRPDVRVFAEQDLEYGVRWSWGRKAAAWVLRCEGLNRSDLRRVMRAYDAAYRRAAREQRQAAGK